MRIKLAKRKITSTSFFSLLLTCIILALLFTSLFSMSKISGLSASENEDDETSTEISDDETREEDEEEDEDKSTAIEDEDDDGIENDIEDLNERQIQVEQREDEVTIESELVSGEKKDKIKIKFEIKDEPNFDLEYRSKSDSSEIELKFEIEFYSLIEYVDSNLNGVYDSTDNTIKEEALEEFSFRSILYSIENSGSSGKIHVFNVTSIDEVFSLQFYVTNEFSIINGSLITPTEAKIDISIKKFPYLFSNSNLALNIKLRAESDYELDDQTEDEEENRASNEKEVEVAMGEFTGFFSWVENASIDGQMLMVNTSQIKTDDLDPDDQEIYLNYPHGEKIFHDPKIGVAGILNLTFIPPKVISNILSLLELTKDEYMLSIVVFTVLVMSGVIIYRIKEKT